MNKLIFKLSTKVILAIILCVIISTIISSFAPILTNDIAIDQLKNDDTHWIYMQTWHQIQSYSPAIFSAIFIIFGISIGKDIHKFIKNRKDM